MNTLTADARLKQRITDESLYRQVCWDSIHTLFVVVGGELPLCLDFNKGDFSTVADSSLLLRSQVHAEKLRGPLMYAKSHSTAERGLRKLGP